MALTPIKSRRLTKGTVLFVIVLGLCWPILASAQRDGSATTEDIEEAEAVQVSSSSSSVPPTDVWVILGRLHPALVHFPIAWIVFLFLVDVGALLFNRQGWQRAGLWVMSLTVLSFMPALLSGFLRAAQLGEQEPLLHLHRNLNLSVLAILVIGFALRLWRKNDLSGAFKVIYLALILGAMALVGFSGHIGGRMVFGENYLPF